MLDQVQTRVVGRDGLETQHFLSSDLEPRWKTPWGLGSTPANHHQGFTLLHGDSFIKIICININ